MLHLSLRCFLLMSVLPCMLAGFSEAASHESGIIAYWKLDEISPGNIIFCSINEHQKGEIIRSERISGEFSPQLQEGMIGKALRCGGSSQYGYFATVAAPPQINGSFTITFWTKPLGPQWMTQLFYYKSQWHSDAGIAIELSGTSLRLMLSGNRNQKLNSEIPLMVGHWAFVAASWDGQTWRLYQNGMLVDEDQSGSHPFKHPGETVPMNIGGYNKHTNNIYNGLMDEVRIWNRALSEKAIGEVMLDDLGRAIN